MDTTSTCCNPKGSRLAHVIAPAGNPVPLGQPNPLPPITTRNARLLKAAILRMLLGKETVTYSHVCNVTHAELRRIEGFVSELRARGFGIEHINPPGFESNPNDPRYRRGVKMHLDAHSVSKAQRYLAGVDF